jgi:CheY-like chemotaxis protein
MSERQCKVLIFDWDENVLIALQHVLEDGGVDTTITWDEIEARKLIKNTPFDLILIGDHPPQLTVEMIQRDFNLQSASCPYLILRATARERDAEHFGRLGITSVIPKRDPYRVLEQVQEHWHPKDSILDRKALTRLTPICERPRESGYANIRCTEKT